MRPVPLHPHAIRRDGRSDLRLLWCQPEHCHRQGRQRHGAQVDWFRQAVGRELRRDPQPCLVPENREHLRAIAHEADVLVPCWGSRNKLPPDLRPYMDETLELLRQMGKPIKHLGLTTSGDPKHPLMLAYSTPLMDFPR